MTWASAQVHDDLEVGALRVLLIVNGELFEPLLQFFRESRLSTKVEQGYARIVGQYIEWYAQTGSSIQTLRGLSKVFLAFTNAFRYGTVQEGEDGSGLWWRPHSVAVTRQSIGRFNTFADWYLEVLGSDERSSIRRSPFANETLLAIARNNHRRDRQLLGHLVPNSVDGAWSEKNHVFRASPPRTRNMLYEQGLAFPNEFITKLLWEGFRHSSRPGNSREIWEKWNIRDILFTLILLFGGKRVSEACHLWVCDVREDPRFEGSAEVFIHDPVDGKVHFKPRLGAETITKRREDYLMVDCEGRLPLTKESGRRHAGWKGNLLHDRKNLAMRVFWIEPTAGQVFLRLWRQYLFHVRPVVTNNPFAFLTRDGQPMGTAAFTENFDRAVTKVGLDPKKTLGTTPHGLRHWYGHQIESLSLPDKLGQVLFAHRSPLSQAIYRESTIEAISATVTAANKSGALSEIAEQLNSLGW